VHQIVAAGQYQPGNLATIAKPKRHLGKVRQHERQQSARLKEAWPRLIQTIASFGILFPLPATR